MTKRILAILLTLTLSLTMFALPTFADDGITAQQTEGKNEISATWYPVTDAAKYEVSVYYNGSQLGTTSTYSHAAKQETYTHKFSINASGTYTIQVIAKDGSGMQVGKLNTTATGNYTQTATSNGITFKRDGSNVTASWTAPKTTKGTPVYTVTYKVGTAASVTQKNITATSFSIEAKETEAVAVTVTYEELNANTLVTSGNIGSATLSASGNATGGTTNTPSTTGSVTYSNGSLVWAHSSIYTLYTVSYYYSGSSTAMKAYVSGTGASSTCSWTVPTGVVSATITATTVTGSTVTVGSWTSNPTSSTGTLNYSNGYLSWASVGNGYTYQVSYVLNGKTYTATTTNNYYQVGGITSATVTYGVAIGTYFNKVGNVGTYNSSSTNVSGLTYSNGYLYWTSNGPNYVYKVTYTTSGVSLYDYVTTTSWAIPTNATSVTVYYGTLSGSDFNYKGVVGYWMASGSGTVGTTGSVYVLNGRTIYWTPQTNASAYYIYSGTTQIGIVTNSVSYTVPEGYTTVTVNSYAKGVLTTLGTATLSSTGTTTTTTTTRGTNCTVVSTASSSTVTWTSTGASFYTVYYVVDSNARTMTTTTPSAIIPVGNANSFTIMIIDSKNNNCAGAYVAKATGSTSSSTTGVKSEIKNLTLTAKNSWTTTVSWNKVSTASYYIVLYSLYGAAEETTPTLTNSIDIPFGSGKDYQVYVYAVDASGARTLVGSAIHIAGDTSSSNTTTTTGSKYVTGFKGTQADGKIKLAWTAADGATSYDVYWKRSSSNTWNKATTTTKTAVNLKGLKNGTNYDFKIVANEKDSSILTIAPSATSTKTVVTTDPTDSGTTTTVNVPTITTATGGTKSASVKWTAVTNATSYKVYFAANGSNTYKAKATVSENGCTVTGLDAGTYKVRVKALVNGTWTSLADCDYVAVTVK